MQAVECWQAGEEAEVDGDFWQQQHLHTKAGLELGRILSEREISCCYCFTLLPTVSQVSCEYSTNTRPEEEHQLKKYQFCFSLSKKAKDPPLLVEIPNRNIGKKMTNARWLEWHGAKQISGGVIENWKVSIWLRRCLQRNEEGLGLEKYANLPLIRVQDQNEIIVQLGQSLTCQDFSRKSKRGERRSFQGQKKMSQTRENGG